MNVTNAESRSAVGIAIHTPYKEKIPGSTINAGVRKITCLVNERIIETLACPIERKKFVVTI